MKLIKKEIHPKIATAINEMYIKDRLEFYYFFLQNVVFYQAEMPTMAAGIHNYKLTMFYGNEFVEDLNMSELKYLIIHELSHLISRHSARSVSHDDHSRANIAMDQIINYMIDKHHGTVATHPIYTKERHDKNMAEGGKMYELLGIKDKVEEFTGKQIGKPMGCTLDPEYEKLVASGSQRLIFEELYEWLKENRPNTGQPPFDIHIDLDNISQEIKDNIVAEVVEKAKMQAATSSGRGSTYGGIEQLLELLLSKPKQNNLRYLRRKIAAMKGKIKQKSYRRLNKRVPGLKGRIKETLSYNVGLDTSGSMNGRFEKVLSQVYRDGYVFNMLQCDTQVNKVQEITDKKQLRKLGICGYGGTDLQPMIDYVLNKKNGIAMNPTILLTDGECGTLDFRGSQQQFLILSTNVEVSYRNGMNVKQVMIQD